MATYIGSPWHSRNNPHFFIVLLVSASILLGIFAVLFIHKLVYSILFFNNLCWFGSNVFMLTSYLQVVC